MISTIGNLAIADITRHEEREVMMLTTLPDSGYMVTLCSNPV